VKREGRILTTLAAAGLILGISSTAQAFLFDDQYSLTQPAAELVMPFDATEGKASFLLVSNPHAVSSEASQISTHWIFWGTNCNELANVSMCLTLNDTVVVDPTNFRGLGPDNEPLGPVVNLTGQRGLVTVIAYETDEDCRSFAQTGGVLKDSAIVGTFTIADTDAGYSFGNDAFGLFLDDSGTQVQLPDGSDVDRYAIQTLNPDSVDASLVVLSHLTEANTIVRPAAANARFFASFYDNLEVPTSLPDVQVGCPVFRTIVGGTTPLIPDFVTVASSGILSLVPEPSLSDSNYLFGIIGQAVGSFGASSRIKVDLCDPLISGCVI
jgi:hypothetical protein